MARFLDGYTPKKKKKDEETQQKKAKSPSVSNNNYKRANQGSDYVSRKDGGQGSGLTRRTANKPTANRQPSYVNRSNNQPMSRKDGGDGFQTSRRTQTQPQTSARTRTTPATSREWMSRKDGGEGTPRRTATERASDLGSRFAQQARTDRKGAGERVAQRFQERFEKPEPSQGEKNFIDYTEGVVKRKTLGYAKTASDLLRSQEGYKPAGRWAEEDPEFARKITSHEFASSADQAFNDYSAKQEKTQKKLSAIEDRSSWVRKTALQAYGSGLEMGIDRLAGPLWAASMFASVYGNQRGQVNKKTERLRQQMLDSGNYSPQEVDEMFADMDQRDRFNAMASAGIEVLSEMLFPGIGIGRKLIGGKGASIAEKVMGRMMTKAASRTGVLGNIARGTLEEIAEEEVGGPLQAKAANVIYGNRLQAISDDNTRRALQNQSDDLRSQIKTPEDAQAVAARLNSDEFYNESKQIYLDAGCTEKEADTLANLSRDYLTASLTGDTETMQKCQDKMVDILSEDQKEHFGLQDAIDSAVSTAMLTVATGAPGAITTSQIGNEYKKNAGMDAVRNLADIAVKYDPDNSIKAQTIRDMIDKGEDISGTQVHELIQIASKAATASFKREDAKDTTAERRMRHEGYLISPAVRAEDGSVILEEKTAERYDDIEAGYMEKAAGLSVPAEAADMAVNIATSYDLGVITAEQMNELSDKDVKEAFSDLTGINLNQYNVYDRKGNILVAESNIRMQNALFAKASDNLVESARLEQLNFDDKARGELIESVTRNTASNGAGAVAVAIRTVDTKDKSKMMLMGAAANRVYEMGMYTNQSWDDVRGAVARQFPGLDSDVLGLVFESGKADKAVQETEFYGRSVRAGEGMTRDSISDQTLVPGEVVNTTGRVIGADEMGFLKDTADNFGIKVVIEDVAPEEVKKENGKTVKRIKEGKYDSKSNTLYVNVNEDVRKPLRAIVTHELTHSTIFAPDEMLELIEYIGDAWYRADPEGYKAAIEARREIYKAQDLSDLELLEEIVADGSIDYDFWNDPSLLDDIATKNQTLAEKFLSAIREILRKLRSVLANEPAEPQNEKQYTAMYAQVVDMAEAERLMMNALKAANKARADKAVSDWQDAVYAKDDTRDSISLAETDAEYMDAVERGDMETAQRMVDEAAREAGYTYRGYHGTNLPTLNENYEPADQTDYANKILPYTIFKPGLSGGIYVATNKEYADAISKGFTRKDGTVMGLYVRFDNPLVVNEHVYDSVPRYFNIPTPSIMKADGYTQDTLATEEISAYAQEHGYDGVIIEGIREGGDIYTDDYIAFDSSNLKLADPVTYDDAGNVIPLSERFNQENKDIRYSQSLSAEQQETILQDVGPDIRFTIGTFRDEQAKGKFIASLNSGKGGFAGLSQIASGKDILRRVMEAKSFAPEQIKAATGFLEHMAGYLESDAVQMKYGFIGWDDLTDAKVSVRKDADGKIVSVAVSAMVVNGEYPVNFDMTTICNKREGVMEIIQALTKKYDADTGKTILNSIKLTDEKMWSINKALKAEGIDTACLGCFVEARRYYTNRFIDKIDDVWNSAVREARKKLGLPEEEYFNFAKGKKVSGEDYNQISDLWTAYDESSESKRSPAQRIKILMDEIVKNKEVDSPYLKLISAEDILTPEGIRGFKELSTHNKDRDMVKMIKSIYGTSAPKEILAFTPYNSEIALLPDKIKGTPTDEYLRSIGGTRVQSFSDFKMEHFFDHLQMVADEAARGFVNHGYSKVIAYPRLFGLTGRKINMSVMFDVLPASEWQKTLGCDEDTATRVARKYQGLRFVTEKPKENVDNRPYKEVTIEGVHGYLTYLVSDADYVNSVFDRLYQENIDAGMSEVEARRKANTDKPFEQSINYREAVELENKDGYKENVGIIGVAFGDEHLKMLLDDPNVRYIIPYHRSGLPVFIAQKTALDIARDYTDFQNTNKAKGGYWITSDGKNERMKSKYEKFVSDNSDLEYPAITFFDKEINGKGYTVEFGKKNNKEKGALAGTADFDVYENLESVKDIREIANAYLEYCIQHNYVPVFHEFAGHPNYYKMLFDFAVTDGTTTNIYPQKPVKNIYPGLNLDEIVKSGRSIDDLTEDDFKDFYAEINRGLAEQNAKTELRRNNLGKVLDQDLLSKNGENSIISDTNIQHIVNGTPDYTSVRYSNEEVTPEPTAADIRNSIAVEYDDAYMDAVNSGNMEEAQRLVDEAAKEAGYGVRAYHGTNDFGFTQIKTSGLESKSDGGYFEWSPFFATDSLDVAQTYSTSYDVRRISDASEEFDEEQFYNDFDNAVDGLVAEINGFAGVYNYMDYSDSPFKEALDELQNTSHPVQGIIDDLSAELSEIISNISWDKANDNYDERPDEDMDVSDYADWLAESGPDADALWDKFSDVAGLLSKYDAYYYGDADNGNYALFANTDNLMQIDAKGVKWNQIPASALTDITGEEQSLVDYVNTRTAAAYARDHGYDGIQISNLYDDGGKGNRQISPATIYIFFKPERQIKSADTVTYAEDGSIIPLSERFDPENNDIRYSMSTTDSEGNILTDGQMEFFKNSQARDEEGRLLNLYHGTVSAGFNMFRADRLIWLTTSRRDADSYGGNWEHKGYDPEEKEQRVPAFGGSYRLDNPFFENYRFDTEEDMQDFIATHPDIDKIKADDELYDMLEEGEIDENEYDRLNKLGEEYEKDYRRYEFNRFGNYTWGDLMDNPEKFTKDDFYRAILEWDKEASVDDLDEVTIEDFLSLMQEEENLHQAEGNTMRDISFRTRIPEGDEGEYVYPVNQRTYEVYANLTNPLIVDIGGKGIEGNYGYVDEMIVGDYDGLILRNCRVGKYHDLGDVVLARQSSQVKLTTNKAPTENPDIRFSMADDNGTMGYAMETAETTDDLWNSDPALEKNRVRYSMSEEDFINMITSRWNEKWLTKGRILDEDSVQKDVMRLAKMVNMNAEDGRKYDSDVLTEITNTAKVLFYMQNSGNEDMANKAAEYAWESANKIIQETEYINDDMYQRYKGIVSYLRDTKIQVPEGLADDVEFSEFIEDNFGKFIVRKKGEDISNVYTHLNKQWPKLFPKLDHPIDQFMQMAEVLDEIQPYRETYSSEEAASLAETVATELMNIARQGEAYVSAADVLKPEFDRKTKALKQRHKEAKERIRTEEKGKRQRQKDRADKWKQRYNDRVQKDKQDRADRTARAEHNKQFGSIQKNYKWLVKRLQDNTKDSNIPEFFKKDLAKMLSVFDLQTEASKKREMHYGPDGYVRRDISNKTLQMEALRTSLEKMHDKYDQFLTNDVITDLIADITKSAEGKSIDALTPVELKKIDDLLKALRHEFVVYNRVRVEGKRIEYAGIGSAQIQSALEHAKKFGAGKDYNKGILGGLDRILNMDELTPAYLFRRIDPENQGLGMMFEQIQNAHDRYIRNTVQIEQWMSEIVGKYHKKGVFKSSAGELEEWRSINHVRKFQLENGETITLTPAQMMSVYCLSNREQAKAHMMGQGVVVAPVSFQATMISDIKQKRSRISHVLTENDIKMIRSTLTDDQVNVANALQELMSTKMAEWGNEASMSVLGIKLFTEKDYFPIKSDRAVLTKDLKAEEFEQAIRNFGFAKAVQPGANNAIMVDDIFSIVAEHCNNMNLYNAYSEAMNDFMKVYNYKNVDENGAVSVEQAVSEAYSQKATAYIMQFMRDLNGNVSGKENTGIADTYNAMLANAKKASVFANIRVAAQQPTAIGRAFMMISPKYAFAMKPSKAAMQEMFDHCPIAKWKSLGYYDINMGRNIESVIMNENNLVEELATAAYGALDNLTWTGIWQMVKAETKDKHPDLEEGTDRYWEACNKRMREVVAFTQVVDSPLHRSHAMRSKTIQAKMTTAFGAEPTITYNMLRDGIVRAVELYRSGDHSGAVGLASKTIGVVMFTTALTAGAAAIADVIRGKDPGDDDDEDGTRTLLEIWWSNFLNNFDDNMNPLNNIYYIKDIKSILEGWETNNLALQGFKYIGLGFNQLTGSKYARSKNSWWENIAYGIGYLTGVPVKTVMTDLGNLIGMAKEKFSIETPVTDAWFEKLDSISLAKDDGKAEAGGAVIDVGADTEDLPDDLTDEQKDEIRKAGEKRKKKNSKKEEVADRDKNKMLYDAEKSAAGYEGAERDKRIWQSVSQGYKDHIANGDYAYIAQMRSVVEQAGGDLDYFDQRIMEASKSALKKTIEPGGADTESEMVAQQNIKMYLLRNGMSAEELSSEIVYKSAGAKDLKVAFRINDNYEIQATATSLIWAGLTADDYNRLYENRNRIDLKKYNGKYKDRLKSTGKYIWPASGPITSPYGYRNSPTRGASSFHQAIDIGASYGSPVVAADGGTVIFAGWNGGGGKTVKIQHDDGSVTFYQHLSWWDAKVGDTVSQGQEIGKVGSTGVSTGPHLDFRVQVNGELVDPMKYLDKLN